MSAAVESFATLGFDGASMRYIASRADVDAALIVHQFGSKLKLWEMAVDRVSGQLLSALANIGLRAPVSDDGKISALSAAVDQLVDVVCDTPLIAQFVLKEIVQQDERFEYIFVKLVRPIHDLLAPLIGDRETPAGGSTDPDFGFFALAGAIVTTIVSRPFMVRMSAAAASEPYFRDQLKRTVKAQLLPFQGGKS
ncbi:MAG: TetR/AcrR family transcriptional regulator [Sphingobium sp.]